ncbi:MAG: rhodanese-like domain-containing protein [Candidatus Nanoarchaeia archaeon]
MEDVSSKKFSEKMEDDNVVVLDVRTKQEHDNAKVPGSVLIDIMQQDFKKNISQLDKSKTYLVYCRSGSRSRHAVKIMQDEDIQSIYHLKNGFNEWQGEGYEVE